MDDSTDAAWIRRMRRPGTVLLRDGKSARESGWLVYDDPREVIVADRPEEVLSSLARAEKAVAAGYEVCGFLAYEAAGALDEAMKTCPPRTGLPLVWLAVYESGEPLAELPKMPGSDFFLGDWTLSKTREAYERDFQKIKGYIADGETYQINYTLRLDAAFSGSAYAFFQKLFLRQPTAYTTWVHTGRHVICSVSPELFYEQHGQSLVSKPMKGTRPTDVDPARSRRNREALVASEKDRAENTMIVDMIRNDLGKVARFGTVETPSLFDIESHPTVWQMTSTVRCQSEAGFSEVIKALFPCASVTGAPKVRAMEIIRELERTSRGVYTGAIGRLGGDGARFNVAIRTACLDTERGRIEYGSGGGIVWDSQAEEEYQECLAKAKIVTEPGEPFSLLETMLYGGRRFFLLEEHLDRLEASARFFGFTFDRREIEARLATFANELGAQRSRVRLLLAKDGQPTFESCSCDRAERKTWKVTFAPWPVDSANPFLIHKTTRREVYERALAECPACDDVLLYNERGEVTESTIANLVVEKEGKRFTPPVESGLLPGTFRRRLLHRGWMESKRLTIQDVVEADRLFLVNSVRGVIPFELIDRGTH